MKAQNIPVDINRLTDEQLEQLAAMLHYTRQSDALIKAIYDRLAFNKGWMSDKAESEYVKKNC